MQCCVRFSSMEYTRGLSGCDMLQACRIALLDTAAHARHCVNQGPVAEHVATEPLQSAGTCTDLRAAVSRCSLSRKRGTTC